MTRKVRTARKLPMLTQERADQIIKQEGEEARQHYEHRCWVINELREMPDG